jgi:arabinogalactan oligomer/maltooligosaccharide transport system permease protein
MSSITVPNPTLLSRLSGKLSGKTGAGRKLPLGRQILLQLMLLLIAGVVLFPIMWIFSLSLDPRGVTRPTELRLIPQGASLQAYKDIIAKPTNNPVTLPQLFFNSVKLAGGTTLAAVFIGIFAAYAFSRFRFAGRQVLMIGVITVLMLPSIATLPALFVLLNKVQLAAGGFKFNLRDSLLGVGLAMTSGALPFAIWNLKGFLDTIPKELEEAALIDGANANQTFFRIILPLAVPALAVTAFVGFMGGWTEFAISWQFLTNPKDFTLTMALWNMTGQYAGSIPWSHFAAMSIIIALPVSIVYLLLQKYIVSGLTIGGVKG